MKKYLLFLLSGFLIGLLMFWFIIDSPDEPKIDDNYTDEVITYASYLDIKNYYLFNITVEEYAYINTSSFPKILYSDDYISDDYLENLINEKIISYDATGEIVTNNFEIISNQLFLENSFTFGYLTIKHIDLDLLETIRYQYITVFANDYDYEEPGDDELQLANDTTFIYYLKIYSKEIAIGIIVILIPLCAFANSRSKHDEKNKKKNGGKKNGKKNN